jgi:hypothetical protein
VGGLMGLKRRDSERKEGKYKKQGAQQWPAFFKLGSLSWEKRKVNTRKRIQDVEEAVDPA